MSRPSPTSRMAVGVSAAFWLTLLVAAALYAAAALGPQFVEWRSVDEEFRQGQRQLLDLERQIERLERVAGALREEQSFAAELARVDFDAARPGEERIPVPAELTLAASSLSTGHERPTFVRRGRSTVDRLAISLTQVRVRRILLSTSAALTILAFSVLTPVNKDVPRAKGLDLRHWLLRRYHS